ncbi:hypothetical protein W97_08721 [Coniosporium apollinis CBS 100218]|uniref:Uncharacterized protein n=1 Tax=Coniosporium apollinis (strain CBS 100218) TaxID=1168221 RepID=R7Z6A1_CONA1|nr:uncharacterized protein W97_08721 [Coniosporium apollinis CBS 100218]EON69461.1 hypothetical protein W97_08721 [Coniosporium apollinis CBS 100218]
MTSVAPAVAAMVNGKKTRNKEGIVGAEIKNVEDEDPTGPAVDGSSICVLHNA